MIPLAFLFLALLLAVWVAVFLILVAIQKLGDRIMGRRSR